MNELVLPRIWSFTTSVDLSIWEKNVNEIDPIIILDEQLTIETFEFSTITFDTYLSLKEVYENISADIKSMISDVIEIGAGNLYGGTGEYSEMTLRPLMNVINRCLFLKVTLPKVETFKKAKYHEEHGWGIEKPRKYYLAD